MEIRRCTSCGTIAVVAGAIRCAKCDGRLELGDERELLGRRFGSYTLVEVVGAGGMGVVFRARHETLERDAAVKLLLPGETGENAHRRFVNEARLLAGLRHPNVVAVYDFAETEWGAPYLVLELLEGRSAEALLADCRERGEEGLPPAVVAAILEDAVAGLNAAHAAGIVHRDLKPSNLFVAVESGRAVTKVIDFGIARTELAAAEATRITATSAIVGTPLYLAPEQLRLEPVGPACDQYALALTACELLSGVAVRDGLTLPQILRFEIVEPVAVRERFPVIGGATARALERATEPDPARRHADLATFLEELSLPAAHRGSDELLSRVLTPRGVEPEATRQPSSETVRLGATRTTAVARPAPRRAGARRRRRGLWAAGVVAVLLAGALLVWLAPRWRSTAKPAAAAQPAPALATMLAEALPAPADSRTILGETEGAWVVSSPGAWSLLAKEGGAVTRIPFPADLAILGAAADGSLWARRAGRLVAIDPVRQSERPQGGAWPAPWATADPAALAVSPRGHFVTLDRGSELWVAELGENGLSRRFTVLLAATGTGRWRSVLTDQRLAVAVAETSLTLFRLSDGHELWRRPLPDHRISALALADGLAWLALGSAVGEVQVLAVADGHEVVRLPRAGMVEALHWIPDRPTLAIGSDNGLELWRPGGARGGAVEAVAGVGGCSDLFFGAATLACLDRTRGRLQRLDYGAAPVAQRVELGGAEAWAAVASPAGVRPPAIYVGDAAGALHRYDLVSGETTERRVHDAGVTALAIEGDRLASASDDRTLAVWKLPAMEVQYRSRAHGYLINALDLAAGSLWSASSDRTVKRWSWPDLEELESVDVDRATGIPAELHALAVDHGGDRLWLGTWQGFALRLDRQKGGWRATRTAIACRAGYRWVRLPLLEARVLLAIEPPELLLFDERRGDVTRLPTFDRPLYGLAAAGGSGFWGTGAATVLRFDLARAAGGALEWSVRGTVATGLGVVTASAAHGDTLALADSRGALLLLDGKVLATTPVLARGSSATPE
ncbi:MAG: protein kinase [Thermoanaerobaculia bacterium]